MKIRTDFVTNSSSSSFTVSIDIRTVDGKRYYAKVEPDDGGGNGSANILCSAEDLLNCSSVESLMDAIYGAVDVSTSAFDDDERCKEYFAKGVRNLASRVKKNVKSLDQIDTLTFRRRLYAWGECSSCFGANIGVYAPELCLVAKKLCDAYDKGNDEESEALHNELLFLLWSYDGCIGESFPSGFMGSSAKCFLDIYTNDDDLIDFAHEIAGGSMSDFNEDDGVETTIIDMQNKKIRHGAVYGDSSWDGIIEDSPRYAELLHFVSNRKREQYTKFRQKYIELVNEIPFSSVPVDYWKKSFIGDTLPEYAINMLGGKSTSFAKQFNSSHRQEPDAFDYWIVDTTPPPKAENVSDYDIKSKLAYMEWLFSAFKKAQDAKVCFIENETFLEMVRQQSLNNYPYTEAVLAAWKASIPFDHISTIDCEDKIIATASLEGNWIYKYLGIEREIQVHFWETPPTHPTRKWLTEQGALMKSDVTCNCDYLIVGLDATIDTPKVAQAIKLRDSGKSNIKIIPEDELLCMLNHGDNSKPPAACKLDLDAPVTFMDKHFVLTCFGWEEASVVAEIEKRGGIVHSSMVKQADYLVVCMKEAKRTTKYQRALEWRTKGVENLIIGNDQLHQAFKQITALSEEELRALQQRREESAKAAEEQIRKIKAAMLEKAEEREAARNRAAEALREEREAALRAAEARREEKEARRKAAAAAQEEIRKEREAQREARELQKAAEKAAKEEKHRLEAEERERRIITDVLYRPGEEPANIRRRMDRLFEKLDGAYPDKKIRGLSKEHKRLSETVTELYRLLGYPDSHAFLEAYGYTIGEQENKGGRPSTVDPTAFIEELKRRYPNGSGCKTVAALERDNSDLPFKTMTNKAQQLFGMSLGDYLKEAGVLKGEVVEIFEEDRVEMQAREDAIEQAAEQKKLVSLGEQRKADEERQDILREAPPQRITADFVISIVAKYYSITVEDLIGKSRKQEIAEARHIAMYLIRETTGLSLQRIGAAFGGRDYTTVMHACDVVKTRIRDYSSTAKQVETLIQTLSETADK